jgi:aspartyl-tRNA(Asn)/glutamyl-tRNA(Gln) amidotransferase subunit C
MDLTKKEIEHIAKLARLDLSDDELKTYGGQLSAILSFVDELKEVDTDNIEPTAQVTGMTNILRNDEINNWPNNEVAEALNQAPGLENKQVKVKRIIE